MGSSLAHFFGQIVSVTVKTIGKTNLVASRHIKRKKVLLPVDARRFAQQRLCLSLLIPELRARKRSVHLLTLLLVLYYS